ncbi:hypothetical protein GUJ93_ZPchr0010g9543, partial [Zizania palustris]
HSGPGKKFSPETCFAVTPVIKSTLGTRLCGERHWAPSQRCAEALVGGLGGVPRWVNHGLGN